MARSARSGARDPVWYFAYGSNLDPETFLGRRRMRPGDAQRARLCGHRLVFDLAIGPGERGVANLLPEPGARVHGVVYALERDEARRLDRTEGVPRAYRRETVEVELEDARRLECFTYVSSHRSPGRRPSRRYLGLLLRGARHHGLPEAWVAELRALPLAVDEREGQLDLFTEGRQAPDRDDR